MAIGLLAAAGCGWLLLTAGCCCCLLPACLRICLPPCLRICLPLLCAARCAADPCLWRAARCAGAPAHACSALHQTPDSCVQRAVGRRVGRRVGKPETHVSKPQNNVFELWHESSIMSPSCLKSLLGDAGVVWGALQCGSSNP